MASIFDKLLAEQKQQEAAAMMAQMSSPMAGQSSPLPPMETKPCACDKEAKLQRINTRLEIAVHAFALLFFIIGIFSFIARKSA